MDLDHIIQIYKSSATKTKRKQKCLINVLRFIDMYGKDLEFKIMMGPSNNKYDTRHFWAEDERGNVYDPTLNDYKMYYKGVEFDLKKNEDFVKTLSKYIT